MSNWWLAHGHSREWKNKPYLDSGACHFCTIFRGLLVRSMLGKPFQKKKNPTHKLLHCLLAWVLSHVQLFVTPWTIAHQAPLPMGFSRQEYWSGLPFPIPGDLPSPEVVSCVSCIGKRILYCRATKEAQLLHYIFPSTKKEAQHLRAFGGLEAACATPRNGGHERLPGLSEAQSRQMPLGRSSQQYGYSCYLDHMIQQTQWCQRHQW